MAGIPPDKGIPGPVKRPGSMGAGGGTPTMSDPGAGQNPQPEPPKKHTAVKAAAVGTGAAAAGQAAWVALMAKLLKQILLMAMEAAKHSVGWLAQGLMIAYNMLMAIPGGALALKGGMALAKGFMAAAKGLSNLLGIGMTAAKTVVAVTTTAAVATTTVAAGSVVSANSTPKGARDGAIVSCTRHVEETQAQTADNTTSGDTLKNAKEAYSILAGAGMSDTNVAGILGNWSVESGIDPTSVEGIYDEKFKIDGPKKQAYINAGFPKGGIGLGQWTAGRNKALRDYADSHGGKWYELKTQLSYMMTAEGSDTQIVLGMAKTSMGSPSEAAEFFMRKWERAGAVESLGQRKAAADKWYAQITSEGNWEKDTATAQSLVAQAGQATTESNAQAASNAASECQSAVDGNAGSNASLAQAVISYAYATKAEGQAYALNKSPRRPGSAPGTATGNDGTELYQELHEYIFPGDPYYQSCDRSIATGVRWAGVDDNFPAGGVSAQLKYLNANPDKWKHLTDWGGDPKNLQPGDILLRDTESPHVSHIVMYVGNPLLKEAFGDKLQPGATIVAGSLGTRSPAAGNWYTGASGLNGYQAFRNIKPEQNSKYKSYVPKATTTVKFSGNAGTGNGVTDITVVEGGSEFGD